MRALHIDFAKPSFFRTLRSIPLLMIMFFILSSCLCISALYLMNGLHEQHTSLASERHNLILQIEERRSRLSSSTVFFIDELEANAINNAVSQLNLPWRDLLDTVEAVTPNSIALVSLEPDGNKNVLKVIAEAKKVEDMLDYVQELKHEPFFETATLLKHVVNDRDPNRPIRFQFEAGWKADSR